MRNEFFRNVEYLTGSERCPPRFREDVALMLAHWKIDNAARGFVQGTHAPTVVHSAPMRLADVGRVLRLEELPHEIEVHEEDDDGIVGWSEDTLAPRW
jgi:hypothetical protein